jgi:hypothetical protein
VKYIKLFEDYKYLPKRLEDEMYYEYKDEIINFILNIKITYDDIIAIINCNKKTYSYSCYIQDFNFSSILNKIRKNLREKLYSTPEITNSFYDLITRIYKENKDKIDSHIDEEIIKYFRNNKEEYIYILKDYDYLDQIFPDRITNKLKFILTSRKFNL